VRAKTAFTIAAVLASVAAGRSAHAEPPRLELQAVAASGSMPKGAVLSPDGKRFYVANYGQQNVHNVYVYDAINLAPIGVIDVPGIVVESVVSPDGGTLYVSNFSRDSVQYVDTTTRRVTREVKVGLHPKIMVLSSDGKRLFAANWNGDSVTEIDVARGSVVRTHPAGKHPRGMALTQAGTLYVANFDGASIEVYSGIDLSSHHQIAACAIPRHLALSPDEATLYVSCYHDSAIEALDTQTEKVMHHVAVGVSPKSIEVTRDGRFVFSADYGPVPAAHASNSSISVLDTRDWTARVFHIDGMDRGSGLALAPDGAHALVTGWNDNHVYLVGFEGTARAGRTGIVHRLPGSEQGLAFERGHLR
jgi:YVTN family beta-propeller protein